MLVSDILDQTIRFPIAYSWQPVKGWPIKHYDVGSNQSLQRTKQQALADGEWDACEKLWVDAFEIPTTDFVFHSGNANDTPDVLFPDEPPHPWTVYNHVKCPAGMSSDATDNLFGIYRTLKTPNYNGSGNQLNAVGGIVAPSDPRTEYFFKPNPANVAIDQLLRWGKRLPEIVNFPAWVDWRDYNDQLIDWDNSKYSPRNLSLTPTTGGMLTSGTTYISRVVTLRSGDVSSASKQSLEHPSNQILLLSGQNAFQVNWLITGDEKDPATPPSDITGYRVYIGTVIAGVDTWSGYFSVSTPTSRNFIVTTLSGIIAGSPPEICSSGLLVQIPRFECGLFVIPPYDLGSMLDRICQIACADWQWSGLGTGTYRNDKIRFMSPANRSSVFTLNQAEIGTGTFTTYAVDRRTRPNEIVVNFRNRDDPYLGPDSVSLPREQLQEDEGQVKIFTIDGGTMYRSQAQRVASYYARILCDLDQMAVLSASPKTYGFLNGDVFNITDETPDWVDEKFICRKKSEHCEGGIGDQMLFQIYENDIYSDTDHSPLPNSLPKRKFNPFTAPLPATTLTLTLDTNLLAIVGSFNFGGIFPEQRAEIFIKGPADTEPSDSTYQLNTIVYPNNGIGIFRISPSIGGKYWIKVVTQSPFGQQDFASGPVAIVDVRPSPVSTIIGNFDDISGDLINDWNGVAYSQNESYEIEYRNGAGSGASTIRGPIVITPSPSAHTPPMKKVHTGNPIPDGQITLLAGGVNFSFHTGDYDIQNYTALVQSKTTGLILGTLVEFEIQSTVSPVIKAPRYMRVDTDDNTSTFYWYRVPNYVSINDYYAPEFNGTPYQAVPGDRLGILFKKDGLVEYHVNYLSEASKPLYTSPNRSNSTKLYRINIKENDPTGPHGGSSITIANIRWTRYGPEFMYIADAQKADNSGSLPSTVYVRVRQLSPLSNSPASDWTYASFVR